MSPRTGRQRTVRALFGLEKDVLPASERGRHCRLTGLQRVDVTPIFGVYL